MASQIFAAVRANPPHWPSVLQTLRSSDPTAGFAPVLGDAFSVVIDKATDWTHTQIAQTQAVIDAAPDNTPELRAQFDVDDMPIWLKALLLALLDQINLLRAKHALAAITPAQAIRAVRDKAGIL